MVDLKSYDHPNQSGKCSTGQLFSEQTLDVDDEQMDMQKD